MHLIVGLGNPGASYAATWHNLGFEVVDRLAGKSKFHRRFSRSLVCGIEIAGREVLLAKPQTYMNLSGAAVADLIYSRGIEPSDTLIVFDDIALPLGRLRIRAKGSSGGQKGMRSVIERLRTEEIPRLRIGIRHGAHPEDLSEYVLSDFGPREAEVLEGVLERAVGACRTWVTDGIRTAMDLYNASS